MIELKVSQLQKKKVLFGTPAYGGQLTVSYTNSMLSLMGEFRKYGLHGEHLFIENESLITRARNNICALFLDKPETTHLFFIDADIKFSPSDALSVIAFCDENRPVVCANYPKKGINWKNIKLAIDYGIPVEQLAEFGDQPVLNLIPTEPGKAREIKFNEPLEVLEGGTGFMCIHKSVFLKMIEAYPDKKFVPDYTLQLKSFDEKKNKYVYAFFDTEIYKNEIKTGSDGEALPRYLSEDYAFCKNWRKIGGRIFTLPWINLCHHGTYSYKGNLIGGLSLQAEKQKREAAIIKPPTE